MWRILFWQTYFTFEIFHCPNIHPPKYFNAFALGHQFCGIYVDKYSLTDIKLIFFPISAARNWLQDESTNHGILITVTTLTGEPIEDGIIRFAQRGKHHDTKQPILVMFTDDVTRKMSPKTKFEGKFCSVGKFLSPQYQKHDKKHLSSPLLQFINSWYQTCIKGIKST